MRRNDRQAKDIVNIMLRLREKLRARIAAAAEENQVSMNHEMNRRLEASFETADLRHIVREEIEACWLRMSLPDPQPNRHLADALADANEAFQRAASEVRRGWRDG